MRFKSIVAYDGWNYAGWQKQANALGIQEVIEKALTKILQSDCTVVASGRTDAKVHAKGQVFHFDGKDIPANRYQQALNTLLPKDIRIVQVEPVDDDFHARFLLSANNMILYVQGIRRIPFPIVINKSFGLTLMLQQ